MYYVTVLEIGSLGWVSQGQNQGTHWQGCKSWGGSGKVAVSSPSAAPRGCPHSLALGLLPPSKLAIALFMDLCFCPHISSAFSASLSPLLGPLWLHWAHPDKSRTISPSQDLQPITCAKFLLPYKVTRSQISGVGMWTSLRSHYSACHSPSHL